MGVQQELPGRYRRRWRHHNFGRRRRHGRGFLRRATAGGAACGAGGARDGIAGVAITGRGTGGAVGRTAAAAGLAAQPAAGGGASGTAADVAADEIARRRAGASGAWALPDARRPGALPCWIAFSTSPGLEMWDRSNLVLISSAPGRAGTRVLRGKQPRRCSGKVLPHILRFVRFDGTGVGLLFGDANGGKEIEDFLALDFQLPGQIVDSNLRLHPPFVSPNFR